MENIKHREIKWILRGHFVCNNCRKTCSASCSEELERIERGEEIEDQNLYPRKQLIGCLGQYCETPCRLQTEKSDLTIDHLIKLCQWMGNKLNQFYTRTSEI